MSNSGVRVAGFSVCSLFLQGDPYERLLGGAGLKAAVRGQVVEQVRNQASLRI